MVNTVFDHHCLTKDNKTFSLKHFKGQVLLIVNTASKCGFTPQLRGLETLYQQFNNLGLEILGFPCNQFGKQDPGPIKEIAQFCEFNYGVTFHVYNKIEVNGGNTDPLFKYLKNSAPGIFGTTAIKWNFTKFLINRTGSEIKRYAPISKPGKLEDCITAMLKE